MPGWLPEVIAFFNYVILTYVIVMQLQVMGIAYLSWRELEQHTFRAKHGRVHDLLTSDTTPPISIVIPAFNEAAGIAGSKLCRAIRYPAQHIIQPSGIRLREITEHIARNGILVARMPDSQPHTPIVRADMGVQGP